MRTLVCIAAIAVFLAVPFSVSRARVDVYRCVLVDGHVSYQQFPCRDESKPIELKDRRSGWTSLRPGEKALLKNYRKKEAARRDKPSVQRKKSVGEEKSCWNKRRQLEAVRSKLRHGYKVKESDALHRKRKNYADYLREFCP